jgi:hypothetical protein
LDNSGPTTEYADRGGDGNPGTDLGELFLDLTGLYVIPSWSGLST